jgi:hypothetical protein
MLTGAEVAQHNTADNLWLIVNGQVRKSSPPSSLLSSFADSVLDVEIGLRSHRLLPSRRTEDPP